MKIRFLPSFVAIFLPCLGLAYGPRSVATSGEMVKWSLPVRVDLESDLTVRGKDLSSLIDKGLSEWVDLSDSNVTFDKKRLSVEIDTDNVCCYLYDSAACPSGPTEDGTNPIVIDDDGTVIAKFFGKANQFTTLGFAAVVAFNSKTGAAVKGEAVFNAACLKDLEMDECKTLSLSFSEEDFISFIVHEMGHFLGLNHSQVNEDTDDSSDDQYITTMYPFFVQGNGSNFKTPERDDQAGLAVLYPETGFSSSYFTVSGTIFDDDGKTEFGCANVLARNSSAAKNKTDAISFVSGQLCAGGSFDKTCDGNYEIQGLDPSQSYDVQVEPIDKDFSGSSGIPPCEGTGERPTFTKPTAVSVSNSAGKTTSDTNFTLTGTSGNVGSLSLPLDFPSLTELDDSVAFDEILSIEVKSASSACPSSSSDDSSDSGGCNLVRPL